MTPVYYQEEANVFVTLCVSSELPFAVKSHAKALQHPLPACIFLLTHCALPSF
jgi:hypothetical protein